MQKIKVSYATWYEYHQTLPKLHRYSMGQRVDTLFVEAIEAISAAAFLTPKEKLPYVRLAIKKLDTTKILLLILWEIKALENNKYINLSLQVDEVGRMLGGWNQD